MSKCFTGSSARQFYSLRATKAATMKTAHIFLGLIFLQIKLIVCKIDEKFIEKYIHLWDTLNYPHIDVFRAVIDSITSDQRLSINSSCRHDLKLFSLGLLERTVESISMIDSSTRARSGNAYAFQLDLGDNRQCQSVLFQANHAKYYLLRVHSHLPSVKETLDIQSSTNLTSRSILLLRTWLTNHMLPQSFAICLPGSCNNDDVKEMISSSYLRQTLPSISFSLNQPRSSTNFNQQVIKFLCKLLLIVLILLNVAGTYFTGINWLTEFNLRDNLIIFSTQVHNPRVKLINYCRFIYILITSIMHLPMPMYFEATAYLFLPTAKIMASSDFARYFFRLNTILMAWNFIVSSSFSVAKWLPIFRTRSVSLASFILFRALRTLPLLLVVICMIILLAEISTENILLNYFFNQMSFKCYTNSWHDVLFISNYLPFGRMCLPVQWFVSSDMQFYILSYIIIISISHTDRIYLCLSLPFLLAAISEFKTSHKYHDDIVNLSKADDWFRGDAVNFMQIHMTSEAHAISYVIGMGLGYLIARDCLWSTKFSRLTACTSFIVILVSLFFPYLINVEQHSRHILSPVLLIQSILFSFSVIILYFCLWCQCDDIFSSTTSSIISKLACIVAKIQYPFFLVHPIVIAIIAISFEHTFTSLTMIMMIFLPLHLFISIGISILLHLTVELPSARLLKRRLRDEKVCKKI